MVVRTYTSQLIVMQTVQYAGEIRAYAARANRSLSTLLRESIEMGWPVVRRRLIMDHGEITPAQRLHGEVTSLLPVSDRAGYERTRRPELIRSKLDAKEYAEIVSPATVGAE
jgi:hypothetical protein